MLAPLLNKFLEDDDVPDRDAVLIPSGTADSAASGFAAILQKLKAIFNFFADLLKNLKSRNTIC